LSRSDRYDYASSRRLHQFEGKVVDGCWEVGGVVEEDWCEEDIWAEEGESKDRAVESELSFKRETEPWWLRPSSMGMREGMRGAGIREKEVPLGVKDYILFLSPSLSLSWCSFG
jgi:hypothetical protein